MNKLSFEQIYDLTQLVDEQESGSEDQQLAFNKLYDAVMLLAEEEENSREFADIRHNNSSHHSSLHLSGKSLKPGQMEVIGVINHCTIIEPRSEKAARAIIQKMEEWLEANT